MGKSNASAPVTYYALDLEQRELERTLTQIAKSDIGEQLAGKVITKGMWGTYDDGLKYIEHGGLDSKHLSDTFSTSTKDTMVSDRVSSPTSSGSITSDAASDPESPMPSTPDGVKPPMHLMFLGSSLGNFSRSSAVTFLKSLPLRPGSGDTLLIGLDHDNDKVTIETAYNDPRGYTKKFIFNALKAAGRALGDETMFDEDKWDYVNRYNTVSGVYDSLYLL